MPDPAVDAVLADVLRRLVVDGIYAALLGDRSHPERGLGLDLEGTVDLLPEEYDALVELGVRETWGGAR